MPDLPAPNGASVRIFSSFTTSLSGRWRGTQSRRHSTGRRASRNASRHHPFGCRRRAGDCGPAGSTAPSLSGYSNTNSAVACALGIALFLLILAIRRLDLSVLAATAISVVTAVGAAGCLDLDLRKGLRIAVAAGFCTIQPDETRAVLDRLVRRHALVRCRRRSDSGPSARSINPVMQRDRSPRLPRQSRYSWERAGSG